MRHRNLNSGRLVDTSNVLIFLPPLDNVSSSYEKLRGIYYNSLNTGKKFDTLASKTRIISLFSCFILLTQFFISFLVFSIKHETSVQKTLEMRRNRRD